MTVSRQEFENMIRWNLPGVNIFEIEENCQVYEWFATFSYLGNDGEATFRNNEFTFHYGMEPHTFCKIAI